MDDAILAMSGKKMLHTPAAPPPAHNRPFLKAATPSPAAPRAPSTKSTQDSSTATSNGSKKKRSSEASEAQVPVSKKAKPHGSTHSAAAVGLQTSTSTSSRGRSMNSILCSVCTSSTWAAAGFKISASSASSSSSSSSSSSGTSRHVIDLLCPAAQGASPCPNYNCNCKPTTAALRQLFVCVANIRLFLVDRAYGLQGPGQGEGEDAGGSGSRDRRTCAVAQLYSSTSIKSTLHNHLAHMRKAVLHAVSLSANAGTKLQPLLVMLERAHNVLFSTKNSSANTASSAIVTASDGMAIHAANTAALSLLTSLDSMYNELLVLAMHAHAAASSGGGSGGGGVGATFPDPYVYKAALYAEHNASGSGSSGLSSPSPSPSPSPSLLLDTRKVENPLALLLYIHNTVENEVFDVARMLASSLQHDKQMFADCYEKGGVAAVMEKVNYINNKSAIGTFSRGSCTSEEAQIALQTGLSPGPNDGTMRVTDPLGSVVGRLWWDTCRDRLAQWAAFACPNDNIIQSIKSFVNTGVLLELGAGTGYWARVLRKVGVRVAALDKKPTVYNATPTTTNSSSSSTKQHHKQQKKHSAGGTERFNDYHGAFPAWTAVMSGTVNDISNMNLIAAAAAAGAGAGAGAGNGDCTAAGTAAGASVSVADLTLFICYPPPGDPMAAQALEVFQGTQVVYVGEMRGDTGTKGYEEQLGKLWRCVYDSENSASLSVGVGADVGVGAQGKTCLPQWSNTAYRATFWIRKPTITSAPAATTDVADSAGAANGADCWPMRCAACQLPLLLSSHHQQLQQHHKRKKSQQQNKQHKQPVQKCYRDKLTRMVFACSVECACTRECVSAVQLAASKRLQGPVVHEALAACGVPRFKSDSSDKSSSGSCGSSGSSGSCGSISSEERTEVPQSQRALYMSLWRHIK